MKSVCVVGLGPAGITAVKELREKGFDVTGYDAGKRIGGRWTLDWDISEHGAWEELQFNQARHVNEFSDFPWRKKDYASVKGVKDDRYGYYPHSSEVVHYLQAYADHFDIMDSMVLNTNVLHIEHGQESNANEWIVHTRDTQSNTTSQKTFQYLVVAQGRYRQSHNPLIEPNGNSPLEHYSGTILHASQFKSVGMAKQKRVLVIGSSVSGCDIAGSIARDGEAAIVHHSVRHVPYVLNHLTDRGAITDEAMFSRLIIWLTTYLPTMISNKGLQAAIGDEFATQVTAAASKSESLVPHADIAKAGVSYAYNWVETLHEGKFTLKPAIRTSTDRTVTFEDGSTEDYDLIICATGYSMDLTILPPDVTDAIQFTHPYYQQTEVALYKWTLVPNRPTLAFCGAGHLIGAPFPCFEMNSRWIANLFADMTSETDQTTHTNAHPQNPGLTTCNRPSETQIAKGVATFQTYRKSSPSHNYDMAIAVTEAMADEMGLAPSKLTTLFNPKRLLLSYPYASYYRTDPKKNDPAVATKALERFEYLVHNVPTGLHR
mmetsp:Transcript_56370/g.65852  ORF Transcript_56370/g.65852 Transcript_56370/m.65852 type:complete len:545 (+) Transcript_56370:130-1764(+)